MSNDQDASARKTPVLELSTPQQTVVKDVNTLFDEPVVDEEGNSYMLREPDPLKQCDFAAALGREHSINGGILVLAMPLIYIESINGEKYQAPGNYNEIRAALKKISNSSLRTITRRIQAFDARSKELEEDIHAVKKS